MKLIKLGNSKLRWPFPQNCDLALLRLLYFVSSLHDNFWGVLEGACRHRHKDNMVHRDDIYCKEGIIKIQGHLMVGHGTSTEKFISIKLNSLSRSGCSNKKIHAMKAGVVYNINIFISLFISMFCEHKHILRLFFVHKYCMTLTEEGLLQPLKQSSFSTFFSVFLASRLKNSFIGGTYLTPLYSL